MKSEKGMSHLIATICALIVIIALILVNIFLKNINDIRIRENLITDMLLIQGRIKIISQENKMNEEEHPLVGDKLADNTENNKVKTLIDSGIISTEEEDYENYYIVNVDSMENLNLHKDIEADCYIVNYVTYEVIFIKGIEIEGNKIYRLTDLIKYKEEKETTQENNETVNEISEEIPVEETVEE